VPRLKQKKPLMINILNKQNMRIKQLSRMQKKQKEFYADRIKGAKKLTTFMGLTNLSG
jgi:hypothetical protein